MKCFVIGAMFVLTIASLSSPVCGQSTSRKDLLMQIEAKRAELTALEKKFLAPAPEDRTTFADLLRQPDTGLIRLLPREVYESESHKTNTKTLTIRGGGAYYSFTARMHEYGNETDIGLEQGHLQVGFAGADYGIIANVGDVRLEQVTPEHPSLRFLAAYRVPSTVQEARSEYQKFASGVTVDGVAYSNRVPVKVNTTYLLRSINYSATDVLVALRVFRKDDDGSVIIAWKLLNKYPKPELAGTDIN